MKRWHCASATGCDDTRRMSSSLDAGTSDQIQSDREKQLAGDGQVGVRQQLVVPQHRAGEAVLDRDDGAVASPLATACEDVVERLAGRSDSIRSPRSLRAASSLNAPRSLGKATEPDPIARILLCSVRYDVQGPSHTRSSSPPGRRSSIASATKRSSTPNSSRWSWRAKGRCWSSPAPAAARRGRSPIASRG